MDSVLAALQDTLEQRKSAEPDGSYVASLYAKGLNKILEKIGEEATEVILAAKDYDETRESRSALIGEIADLWFHSLVAMTHLGLNHAEVEAELARRFGISGLAEKAARSGA